MKQKFPFQSISRYAKNPYSIITAQTLVKVIYAFFLYSSIKLFSDWGLSIKAGATALNVLTLFWIRLVDFDLAFTLIRILFIFASFLSIIFTGWRWVRILVFITLLEFVSMYFSILQLDVDWYIWILVSFLLIFLPKDWAKSKLSQRSGQKLLFILWGCQAISLLTYSMAGIGKILGAISQIFNGQVNAFDPKAGALHIAGRLIETNQTAPLAYWAVDHYLIVWPFFIGTIFLLLFSFPVAFKPNLHRFWGAFLILFHIVNYLVINIGFSAHVFIDSLLLIFSPFAPVKISYWEVLFDIPVAGGLFRMITRRL